MPILASLLTRVSFADHETPAVAVDPATRFVYVAGPEGVERVDSAYRKVLVPMFDWQ